MNDYVSNGMLEEVFTRAEHEELEALSKALHGDSGKEVQPSKLQAEVCAAAGHAVANFLRNGEGISYAELLFDAAESLKVENLTSRYSPILYGLPMAQLDSISSERAKYILPNERLKFIDAYVDELERKLLSKLMAAAYEKASPEQRAAVDAKLAEMAKSSEGKNLSGLSTTAALLAAGNLGGFATYTLMSTVLSALSVGTLGFGAYTFAASVLSLILSPAGWLSLAIYGAFKLGSPNKGKVVQLAATCALISQRLREFESHHK